MDLIQKTAELKAQHLPFALATVVSCENPTSAKPGAKALILEDGTMYGWVGGSCAQPIVIKEAKIALRNGLPKLLKIGTNEAADYGRNNGVKNYEMTCYSGGAMEIFIEPVLPKAQLILVGNSPDLQMLASLGNAIGYQIKVFDPEVANGSFPEDAVISTSIDFENLKNQEQAFFVIATHGRYDEEAVLKALSTEAVYIGLISSKKRAAAISSFLETKGIKKEGWERVKSPAGLDLGAKTPEEIAVSILAEIVEFRRRHEALPADSEVDLVPESTQEAIDPICGMSVNTTSAKFKTEFMDVDYFFCCAGCLKKFETEPGKYVQEQPV